MGNEIKGKKLLDDKKTAGGEKIITQCQNYWVSAAPPAESVPHKVEQQKILPRILPKKLLLFSL